MNLHKQTQIPPGRISSRSLRPHLSLLSYPATPCDHSSHCRRTECRGTGTAAYLAGNAAPCRLCSIALTPTEERGDTDFHSRSLIKLRWCKHIAQFQKGVTKARWLCEEEQGKGKRDDKQSQTRQT